MHQFEISTIAEIKLGSIDASFTNASLWMVIEISCSVSLTFCLKTILTIGGNPKSVNSWLCLSYSAMNNSARC